MEIKKVGYGLARIAIGVNFLGHGLARLPKVEAFSNTITELYTHTWLPLWSVKIWTSTLPFLEFIIGIMLVFGLLTRYTLLAAFAVITLLIFGSCLIENWDWAGFQMIYGLYLFMLLMYVEYDKYSTDNLINRFMNCQFKSVK